LMARIRFSGRMGSCSEKAAHSVFERSGRRFA
jgi:hypothetical protein